MDETENGSSQKGVPPPFVIRDPVHRYLVVAGYERIVVDHPITQRLRRIAQTGLASLVYPQATTSRFVHSLGAMHLASRFVVASLENAEEDVALGFFEEIRKWLRDSQAYQVNEGDLDAFLPAGGTLNALIALRAVFHQPRLAQEGDKYRRLLALAEAATRLAALFHDLGHLPFSHDLEYALKDYMEELQHGNSEVDAALVSIASKSAPHEEIGHKLADLVFRYLAKDAAPHVRAAFALARDILDKSPNYELVQRAHASPIAWMHSVVDGEIDSDRADYLLRDGMSLGLDFAHYDLDRLVYNLKLIKHDEMGYVTAVDERGLPALESFCLTRYRSNEAFVRHHKVVQAAAALRHSSRLTLDSEHGKPLLDCLARLGKADDLGKNEIESLLSEFATYDDAWWIQALRKRRTDISKDDLAEECFGLVLDRARNLKSVWKRKGDLSGEQRKLLNEFADGYYAAAPEDKKELKKLELRDKRDKLYSEGVLIVIHRFKAYGIRPEGHQSIMLVQTKTKQGTARSASELSTLIGTLRDAWKQDVHLHAFARSPFSTEQLIQVLSPTTQ